MEASKTGILLVNLGTPDSPATADVRKYLVEFLSDERVIDIPALQRNLLVRGIIGPFRAPKSAKSYREIWTKEGSPLMTISVALREKVAEALGDNYQVELAMRYQSPSIASALERFKGKFCSRREFAEVSVLVELSVQENVWPAGNAEAISKQQMALPAALCVFKCIGKRKYLH